MSRPLLSAAVTAIGLLAGCTATVAGQPARPVNVVERALPTAAEVAKVLGFPVDADTAPQLGGLDTLRDAKDSVSPHDCIGITHAGYRQSYEGAPVRDSGRKLWIASDKTDEHVSAAVSIVELDAAHSAQSWYAKNATQWLKCRGVTVTERLHKLAFFETISRVTDSKGTLSAQIALTTDDSMISPGVNWRALTATSRYLVDVEIFRIGNDSGAADPDPSAMARFVVGKIDDLR